MKATILVGDVLNRLAELPDGSVPPQPPRDPAPPLPVGYIPHNNGPSRGDGSLPPASEAVRSLRVRGAASHRRVCVHNQNSFAERGSPPGWELGGDGRRHAFGVCASGILSS